MVKNSKKIRILGKGKGWEKCPDNDEFEVWGLNGLIFANKKLDRVFIMDVVDEMPSVTSGIWKIDDVINKINELNIPFIGPYKYEEIPKSEAFPIEEAIREFGIPYFNNTIAYMICYALLRGVEELQIWGVNQSSGTEYFYEKGCVEYWLGIATGMGVKVSIHGNESELLRNKERYGGDRLYGYNLAYEQILQLSEKFGKPVVKKLKRRDTNPLRVVHLGPEKIKGLRTTDVLGIREIWKRFASHPEGKWIISLNDALNLARFAVEYKPKKVLDLGTGIGASAAVLKYILPDAEVISVEQFEKCIKIARPFIYSVVGKPVNIVHCEPEVFELEEVPETKFSGYKNLPEGEWDMVIIDGPGDFLHNGHLARFPNGDIFRIIDNIKPGGIVYVDGRSETVQLIGRFLGPFLKPIIIGNDFAAFERTQQGYNKELVVDKLKEQLIKSNYFN